MILWENVDIMIPADDKSPVCGEEGKLQIGWENLRRMDGLDGEIDRIVAERYLPCRLGLWQKMP